MEEAGEVTKPWSYREVQIKHGRTRMFLLRVDTENDAFNHEDELARVLRGVARSVEAMPDRRAGGVVRDINGNACGSWDYIPDSEVD